MVVLCADCGVRLREVTISTKFGAGTDTGEVGESWQIQPSRCSDCLDRTRDRVDAIVNQIGPALLMQLWGASA